MSDVSHPLWDWDPNDEIRIRNYKRFRRIKAPPGMPKTRSRSLLELWRRFQDPVAGGGLLTVSQRYIKQYGLGDEALVLGLLWSWFETGPDGTPREAVLERHRETTRTGSRSIKRWAIPQPAVKLAQLLCRPFVAIQDCLTSLEQRRLIFRYGDSVWLNRKLTKKNHKRDTRTLVPRVFLSLVPDLTQALVLSRMFYWFTPIPNDERERVTIHYKGRLYHGKPPEHLSKETGLSVPVVEEAIVALKRQGFFKRGYYPYLRDRTQFLWLNVPKIWFEYPAALERLRVAEGIDALLPPQE